MYIFIRKIFVFFAAIFFSCTQYDNVRIADGDLIYWKNKNENKIIKMGYYSQIFLKGAKPLYAYKIKNGKKIIKVNFNKDGNIKDFITLPAVKDFNIEAKFYYNQKLLKSIEYCTNNEKRIYMFKYNKKRLIQIKQVSATGKIILITDIIIQGNMFFKIYHTPQSLHIIREVFFLKKNKINGVYYDNSLIAKLLAPAIGEDISFIKKNIFLDKKIVNTPIGKLIKKYLYIN